MHYRQVQASIPRYLDLARVSTLRFSNALSHIVARRSTGKFK